MLKTATKQNKSKRKHNKMLAKVYQKTLCVYVYTHTHMAFWIHPGHSYDVFCEFRLFGFFMLLLHHI